MRPTSFSSTATSSMSDMPLHMEMMHWWITSVPNLAWASAAARNTASSPSVSSLYLTKAELSGRALRSSLSSRLTRASSLSVQIGHPGYRRVEQFRHRALMHGGILPDIEPGEMEAETVDGPAQRPQPAARDHAGIVRDQRTIEHVEIGLEFLHARIGRGLADRPAVGFDLQPHRGRRQAGIDAGHRESIGLAAPMRRGVRRAPGQRAQLVGNIGKMRRQRQLRAEDVQLLQIEVHHPARSAGAACRA